MQQGSVFFDPSEFGNIKALYIELAGIGALEPEDRFNREVIYFSCNRRIRRRFRPVPEGRETNPKPRE